MLLVLPALQRVPQPERVLLHLPRLPVPTPPAPPRARHGAGVSQSLPPAITPVAPPSPVPTQPSAATPAVSASAAAALDLRLPLAGPQPSWRHPDTLAAQLRSDPRSHSPRLSLEERMSKALGTPCFVDELDADGQVRRYPGQLVALPTLADQIHQGVTANLGVGGQAPPIATRVCQRR
jgi:hypothetical protein